MKTRSEIIINYLAAKLDYEALVEKSITNDEMYNDLQSLKGSITDEVHEGLFEEAFGQPEPGYVPIGICNRSKVTVFYVLERALKPATAVSAASKKFGLSEETTSSSTIMSKTFKGSDYLKYKYLLEKKKEEQEDALSSAKKVAASSTFGAFY